MDALASAQRIERLVRGRGRPIAASIDGNILEMTDATRAGTGCFMDRQASVARLIRYPAVTKPPLSGQLRAGTHTDYGIMTFVRGDDTPGGLQVKHRQGGWIDVHPPRGSFVCNIGDLMMRWSNDRWVSTLHRVAVPPPDAVPTDRISLVFFQNPNPDTVIRCFESCVGPDGMEKYPPITVAEHYLGKASHSRLDAEVADAMTDAR
jgi:isopenicillin N synthase-like dioxygenase